MATNCHRASTATSGMQMGTRILKKKVISLAPSTSEASRSSRGTPW